jgi:hypothetical protein
MEPPENSSHAAGFVAMRVLESGKRSAKTVYLEVKAGNLDKIVVHEKAPFPEALI